MRLRGMGRVAAVILVVQCIAGIATLAETPSAAPGPPAAAPGTETMSQGGSRFDVAAATAAYLAKVPPDKKARSDAYFEGGYWLLLWDFLWNGAAFWLILRLGWSAAMRDRAERISSRLGPWLRWTRTALYWAQLCVVFTILQFPIAAYEGFFREHKYGLSTQTFGAWLGDQAKGLGVALVLYSILFTLLYAVLRRSKNWWLWGSLVAVVFLSFVTLIAPVFIFPLFNTFTKLEDPAIRTPILSMARQNGIGVDDVYVMDASRQTTRISANVSGLLGTTRISLNDNLLRRCSLEEIESVMGHEMGHYVLHHNYKGTAALGLVILLGFVFLHLSYDRALRRFGAKWRVSGIGDVAGLPLLMTLFL
ncbi:MAG TPA: M48 family metalloprotease, partial [Candidatus Polarisedimenticolia bacterium]|nr:M48 family metalloprotease [Candidatus Polarisedimenticolia bacterium]